MSHARTKSTAKKGNPKQASRGAAAERARKAFDAARDAYIWEIELAILANTIGLPFDAPEELVRQRVDTATIEELERWTAAYQEQPGTKGAAA